MDNSPRVPSSFFTEVATMSSRSRLCDSAALVWMAAEAKGPKFRIWPMDSFANIFNIFHPKRSPSTDETYSENAKKKVVGEWQMTDVSVELDTILIHA